MQHASVSGAIPTDVAGQAAYEVRVARAATAASSVARRSGGTPPTACRCRSPCTPSTTPRPCSQLSATSVSYGPIDPSVFTPPVAAKTQTIDLSSHAADHPGASGTGTSGAPATLPFTPSEPAALDGQSLTSKRLVHVNGHVAELLFYGHGLGGIAVLERAAKPGSAPGAGSAGAGQGDQSGPSLPTVTINGISAHRDPDRPRHARAVHQGRRLLHGGRLGADRRRRTGGRRTLSEPPAPAVSDAPGAATDPPDDDEVLPVRARGLVKRYGEIVAVDHVDLNVRAGDVYGYLGPNGAGKTTSLRMALGLIRPTEGTVTLFGRDPQRDGARALDGVAGFVEAPRFYPYLSGMANLRLLASLDGDGAAARIESALATVDLTPRARHKVGGYSHGMRQRLGIAAALLRSPRLLILDEPATGLDPAGMRDMRLLIRRLAGEGITVLLSSHQLAEVEELCDRVAIIRSGRVVYEGALIDLKRTAASGYHLRTSDDAVALRVCLEQPGLRDVRDGGDGLHFSAAESDVERLSIALVEAGVGIRALAPHTASLEDLFFRLTEGEAAEAQAGSAAVPGNGRGPAPAGVSGSEAP